MKPIYIRFKSFVTIAANNCIGPITTHCPLSMTLKSYNFLADY